MAPTTPITATQIELCLTNVRDMLTDLPELASEKAAGAVPESEFLSWALDWDQAAGSDVVVLDRAYRSGLMTQDQQARYRDVLRHLKEALPVLRSVGLTEPRISLDVAA